MPRRRWRRNLSFGGPVDQTIKAPDEALPRGRRHCALAIKRRVGLSAHPTKALSDTIAEKLRAAQYGVWLILTVRCRSMCSPSRC